MDMKLPFSTTGMMLHIDDSMDYEVLSSSIESMPKSDKTEDEIVLEMIKEKLAKYPDIKLLLVPRHTQRLPKIIDIINTVKSNFIRNIINFKCSSF